MLKNKILVALFLLGSITPISLTSCQNNSLFDNIIENGAYKNVSGKVFFPDYELKFKTQATISNISPKSIVTLSYPSDYVTVSLRNVVIATGLTDSLGNFTLNAETTFKPKVGDFFVLEATKRLEGAGFSNLALRTNVKWTGTAYESISKNATYINSKTTAMSIITSLKPTSLSVAATIGTLNPNDQVITITDTNATVSLSEIQTVTDLVDKALLQNKDPVATIVWANTTYLLRNSNAENPIFTGCLGDPVTCNPPSPTPTPVPITTPTALPTAIPTPIPTPTPTDVPIATTLPTPVPTDTPLPTPVPTPLPTPTPTDIPLPDPTPTPTPVG
ncbi:MAG: hypothetical protein AABZ74_05890 [Cyanobacteriota bacterium]